MSVIVRGPRPSRLDWYVIPSFLPLYISDNQADAWTTGVDQKILGQAAVNAARIARKDKTPSKYWVLEQAEIIKYGRDEWKDRSIRQSGTEL